MTYPTHCPLRCSNFLHLVALFPSLSHYHYLLRVLVTHQRTCSMYQLHNTTFIIWKKDIARSRRLVNCHVIVTAHDTPNLSQDKEFPSNACKGFEQKILLCATLEYTAGNVVLVCERWICCPSARLLVLQNCRPKRHPKTPPKQVATKTRNDLSRDI